MYFDELFIILRASHLQKFPMLSCRYRLWGPGGSAVQLHNLPRHIDLGPVLLDLFLQL